MRLLSIKLRLFTQALILSWSAGSIKSKVKSNLGVCAIIRINKATNSYSSLLLNALFSKTWAVNVLMIKMKSSGSNSLTSNIILRWSKSIIRMYIYLCRVSFSFLEINFSKISNVYGSSSLSVAESYSVSLTTSSSKPTSSLSSPATLL